MLRQHERFARGEGRVNAVRGDHADTGHGAPRQEIGPKGTMRLGTIDVDGLPGLAVIGAELNIEVERIAIGISGGPGEIQVAVGQDRSLQLQRGSVGADVHFGQHGIGVDEPEDASVRVHRQSAPDDSGADLAVGERLRRGGLIHEHHACGIHQLKTQRKVQRQIRGQLRQLGEGIGTEQRGRQGVSREEFSSIRRQMEYSVDDQERRGGERVQADPIAPNASRQTRRAEIESD